MRYQLAYILNAMLRSLGVKTISLQFSISYLMIFIFTMASVASLFMHLKDTNTAIKVAGRQAMLTQELAKEAFLVSNGVESKALFSQTIKEFEKSHRALIDGNQSMGVAPPSSEKVSRQLEAVDALWSRYKQTIQSYANKPSKAKLRDIYSDSDDILKEMNQAVEWMAEASSSTAQKQQSIVIFFGICTLLIVIVSRFLGMHWLMSQIALLRDRLNDVSHGDFSKPITEAASDNEVGDMFNAYNNMLNQVGSVISSAQSLSGGISDNINNISHATHQSEQSVLKQNQELDAVATAINQMSATINDVAGNTAQAATTATDAASTAQEGHRVVEFANQYIVQMAEQLKEATSVMEQLDADSQEIGQVLSVITGIAEQTNLLALNAAIEAARAGEQGRGFAVVADEVRTLASRTQESTEEIRKIIERLQSQSTKAVEVMQASGEQAAESAKQTEKANHSLQSIVAAVSKILDMSSLIATAAEQQAAVSAEVDKNITTIAGGAQETASTVSDLAATAQQMRTQVEELDHVIANFSL